MHKHTHTAKEYMCITVLCKYMQIPHVHTRLYAQMHIQICKHTYLHSIHEELIAHFFNKWCKSHVFLECIPGQINQTDVG